MRHVSSPEGPSLPNRDLYLGNKHVRLRPSIDLRSVRRLEEQGQRLGQIGASLFDRGALAGDIELWTKGDVAVSLSFDNGCEDPKRGHGSIVSLAPTELSGL